MIALEVDWPFWAMLTEKLSSAPYQKFMLAVEPEDVKPADVLPPDATVPREWIAASPSFPAATTNATPDSWAKSSSARSSTAVPSCAQLCEPHELLMTTGLPRSDALAITHAHASIALAVVKSYLTTMIPALGATPYVPAAMLATCVPCPSVSRCEHVDELIWETVHSVP